MYFMYFSNYYKKRSTISIETMTNKFKISEIKTDSKSQQDYVDINMVFPILDDDDYTKEEKMIHLENFLNKLKQELLYL